MLKNELMDRMEAVYQQFLGIKILFETCIPAEKYIIKNDYFNYMTLETKKLILGRLHCLICDKKDEKYNTISLKILIDEMKSFQSEAENKFKKEFEDIDKRIKEHVEDKNLKKFRDKMFAHTELDEQNCLLALSCFGISDKSITDLFNLASEACETLRLYLSNCGTAQMHDPIAGLSSKLWDCYENIGLVEKLK